jgi:hypothetical protein
MYRPTVADYLALFTTRRTATIDYNLTVNMSLVVFPRKKPTKTQLANIIQIEYTLWGYNETDQNLLNVHAFNNRRPKTESDDEDPNPYAWSVVPVSYAPSISLAFYRFEMLKVAATDTVANDGDRGHIETAAINLHYLNMVLDQLWINSDKAVVAKEMNGDWRCDDFDRWVRAEFYVRKQSPDAIADWEAANPNIAWKDIQIGDLGTGSYMISDFLPTTNLL